MSKIPVTVLTGYLGAGKTTLINRILTEEHGRRFAVIVNEFGEEGIDADLILSADEDVVEMNNGCVCCTVRGDLIRILDDLLQRGKPIDAILIETTGLADPGPVAQTFFLNDEALTRCRLDAIVTVVDAKHALGTLASSHQAINQVAFADVILLNKTDLVDAGELAAVEARVRALAPAACVLATEQSAVPLEAVLDRGAFSLDRALSLDPDFLDGHGHHHHQDGITSLSLVSDRAVNPDRFMNWMQELLVERGSDLLRSKGVLAFQNERRKFVFQGVQTLLDGDVQKEWQPDEARRSRLVLIGRNLDAAGLRQGFESCMV